jgi:multicomponent Na+:H+ antiporter subunit G
MDVLVSAFLLIGGSFVLVAAIGLVRLPDLLMRMHAATKAGTLGAGLLLAAVAVTVPGEGVAVKAIATVVFLLLTAPIASHVIARSAYHAGDIRLWVRTHVDELAEDLEKRGAMKAATDQRLAPNAATEDLPPLSEAVSQPPRLSP